MVIASHPRGGTQFPSHLSQTGSPPEIRCVFRSTFRLLRPGFHRSHGCVTFSSRKLYARLWNLSKSGNMPLRAEFPFRPEIRFQPVRSEASGVDAFALIHPRNLRVRQNSLRARHGECEAGRRNHGRDERGESPDLRMVESRPSVSFPWSLPDSFDGDGCLPRWSFRHQAPPGNRPGFDPDSVPRRRVVVRSGGVPAQFAGRLFPKRVFRRPGESLGRLVGSSRISNALPRCRSGRLCADVRRNPRSGDRRLGDETARSDSNTGRRTAVPLRGTDSVNPRAMRRQIRTE